MKKFLATLVVLGLVLMPTVVLGQIPESLEVASGDMVQAVRGNPVNLAEYISTQIDFWGELLIKFAKTAKPNVVFNKEACAGLQLTLYEQESWAVVAGKVFRYTGQELIDQPGFVGIEWRGFPLLQDLSQIFEKLNPQIIFCEKQFSFGLTFEFKK